MLGHFVISVFTAVLHWIDLSKAKPQWSDILVALIVMQVRKHPIFSLKSQTVTIPRDASHSGESILGQLDAPHQTRLIS